MPEIPPDWTEPERWVWDRVDHMMSVSTGRERTEAEFVDLLDQSGWRHVQTWRQPQGSIAVVEGAKP